MKAETPCLYVLTSFLNIGYQDHELSSILDSVPHLIFSDEFFRDYYRGRSMEKRYKCRSTETYDELNKLLSCIKGFGTRRGGMMSATKVNDNYLSDFYKKRSLEKLDECREGVFETRDELISYLKKYMTKELDMMTAMRVTEVMSEGELVVHHERLNIQKLINHYW